MMNHSKAFLDETSTFQKKRNLSSSEKESFHRSSGKESSNEDVSPDIRDYLISMRPIVPYLKLSDLAKLTSLNKEVLKGIREDPYIFLYMIKYLCLEEARIPARAEEFFSLILIERPRFDFKDKTLIKNAIRKLETRNLVLNSCGENGFEGWKIDENGGDRWKVENFFVPKEFGACWVASYRLCKMNYDVPVAKFSSNFLAKFIQGEALIKVGIFISRRLDCEAEGGIMVSIIDRCSAKGFRKTWNNKSNEIPVSWSDGVVYKELSIEVRYADLYGNAKYDLEKSSIRLTIEGKDLRIWKGWYGPRFTGAYIRGVYLDSDTLVKKKTNLF